MNHTITVTIQNSKNKQEAVYSDGYYIYIKSTFSYTVQQSDCQQGESKIQIMSEFKLLWHSCYKFVA